MKLLSKTITRRFKDSKYLFFTTCLVHPIDVPFLSSMRYILFKDPLKRHSRYNHFRRHWISEISNCYRKTSTVQSWVQVNTNSQGTEITDPLYGFLLCLCWTHTELPENFSFGISVLHNSTLGKILKIQLTLISARRAKDCCRSPLLVAFKITEIYFSPPVLFIHLTFHSWAPYGYILFKDPLKRHSRYNDFRRHCRLIKCFPVCNSEICALPQPPQT